MALIGTGTAFAGKATRTGSVTCTSVVGTLKFNPPLATNGGTTGSETTSVKAKVSGCTGGTPVPSGATITSSTTTNNGNKCSNFGSGVAKAATTFTIKWTGAINPTTVTYPAGSITVTGGGSGFHLGGGAVTGAGSYPGSDNFKTSTSDATSNVNLETGLCAGGKPQKSINIVSGTSHLG